MQEPLTAVYELSYQPGSLTAVGYRDGREIGRDVLKTADTPVKLQPFAERQVLSADGQSLAFITVDLTDASGNRNLWKKRKSPSPWRDRRFYRALALPLPAMRAPGYRPDSGSRAEPAPESPERAQPGVFL